MDLYLSVAQGFGTPDLFALSSKHIACANPPSAERLTQMQMSLIPQPFFCPFDSLVRSQHQFISLPPQDVSSFAVRMSEDALSPPTQEIIHIKFLSPGFRKQLYPKILILTT